ncbi:ABC transporter substrate-binding protein [Desulfococcaceae bacterium HSG7]|nr:ABC transporter substrate-binding protein [Desulfococcaceae bacterium HSG7]
MRQNWKRANVTKTVKFTALLLVMSTLAVVPGILAAQEAQPKYGGALRLVGELGAMGFDAIKARSSYGAGRAIGSLVMERLFNRGKDDTLIPVLGLSIESSEDGKTWTVKLRQGVKFHDRTPFNADAVVKHWQRLLNPKNRYRQRIYFRPIAAVEKAGEYEVRFLLKHAWIPFISVLTDPSGFTAPIPSPKAVAEDVHNRAPVGTGPFIFKEWKSGDRITVTKNPDYWQKGKPYLDEISYSAIPDHQSRYAALVSGQADMMITDRQVHVKKLTANPDFTKYVINFRGAIVLVMNCSKPPLDDVRVRRAIAHAWDQKKYIKASLKDIAPSAEHWFGDALNCAETGYLGHDLKKAESLIAEYGKPVELEYVHSATSRGRETAVILQQMMKKIGVKINPVPSDFPGIIKKMFSKKFDMSSWSIRGFYDMGPVTMAQLHSKSPWNMSRYANEEVDRLLVKQRMSTDPEVRADAMCMIARKVNADTPFLYLFDRRYYLFAKNNIKNITPPVLGEEGTLLADIWIDKDQ